MLSLKTLAASYTLAAKLEPEKCTSVLKALGIKRSTILDYVYPNNVKISVVQMKLAAKDVKTSIQEIHRILDTAVQAGSHVVLFPHLMGLTPLTADKGSTAVCSHFIEDMIAGRLTDSALTNHFLDLAERFSDFLFDYYYNLFLMLAHQYNIYIAAGSTYVLTGQGMVCRSYLFSPDQDEAYFQDKIHLSPMEKRLGLQGGNELHVLDLKVGKVALLAGCDAEYYECFKVAKSLGAQIILSPALGVGSFFTQQRFNAALMHAQHFNLYTARASFYSTGDLITAFPGVSGIYAPLAMTKDLDGVIQQTDEAMTEKGENVVLSARIDPPKLMENMDVYSFSTNSAFCDNMMNNIYPQFYKNGVPAPTGAADAE